MTREETIKVLAILKAAYPNSYKNMTKEEANGTVGIWSVQFAKYPAELVMAAVNKIISISTFPPSIAEVKEKISGMYWEIWEILNTNSSFPTLTPEQEMMYTRMMDVIEPLRINPKGEPSLAEILGNQKLLSAGDD